MGIFLPPAISQVRPGFGSREYGDKIDKHLMHEPRSFG